MSGTLIEPTVEREEPPWKPVAHLSFDMIVALCGAEILGIKARGDFEPCEACLEAWARLREEAS